MTEHCAGKSGGLSAARLFRAALAGFALCSASAAAQASDMLGATEAEIQDQQRWRVIFSPYVWGASLNGTAGVLGYSTDVKMPFHEIFKNLDVGLMGNLEVTNGTFGVYVDGQYVKTSQDEDILDNELALQVINTTLAAGAYYRVYEQELGGATLFGRPRVFAIEPTLGVRWTQIDAKVEVGPMTARRKVQWTDPFIGARMIYDIDDRWNFAAEADIGGFGAGTDFSAHGQAYLGYRTMIRDVPTMFRVGYRVLYQDYDGGDNVSDFKYRVTQHGPVVGLSITF